MRDQSTLKPASHAAQAIADLWWILFVVSVIVFFVVVALLLVGVLRRRGGGEPDRSTSRGATKFVAIAGVVVPAVVVISLFFASVATLPAVSPAGKNARMTIDVVGRQWFWDVYYRSRSIRTSNEIHIPVGVPVEIRVTSDDVIHSLWVPRLNRKIDVIPGQTSSVVFDANKAGVFRGQCAEFCGVEHGNMALLVIAEPQTRFDRWLTNEAKPAPASAGLSAFVGSGCSGCHAISGAPQQSRFGPDLSHFGLRQTIGAGTLTNTPEQLADWIRDPQRIKPGNKMPKLGLPEPEIQALVRYLESLQ
ncbi:MAG: cytochrome c oxidase subunit II [Actinobacteria bacterium]|jgi:cytochrome c oxidase subunit 2|nr:MAG: cytochrome c oxidase subunit II [Actinomycetota bacterium]